MALPEADAANIPKFEANLLTNWKSLATNLRNQQTFGKASQRNLNATAECAFAHRFEDYADRKFKLPSTTRSTFLMVFSPNGKLVASTHGDHVIYVSDVATGKCIRELTGHPRTPWCLAFHPVNNDLLASGCLGGQVRVWDLCGGSEVWCSDGQTVIASIAFHPSSDCLLVVATHNEIHFWDWNKKSPFMKIATKHEKERVRFVTFDSTGHKLFTGIANRLLYTTPAPGPFIASDDSDEDVLILRNVNVTPLRDIHGPQEPAAVASGSSSSSTAAPNNISEELSARDVAGASMDRLVRRLMSWPEVASHRQNNATGEAHSSRSSSSTSTSTLPSMSSAPPNNQERAADVPPRHSVTARRSSTTPQTRRRIPISPGLLNRSEANRTLTNQQNRRLFVREFASQLFSMFSSYSREMSSDSENEAVEPEAAPAPPGYAPRVRTGGVPGLNERYRRFRPLRVGRWNSNIIAQSNMITQGHLIVHSPNDANAASGSSRQPTTGERGYIFGNIHVNHRIQCWSFGESSFPPDISDSSKNIVVPKCKINNDSSVSISSCNQYLAAIIPAYRAQDVKISIFSVTGDSLGQRLFTHSLARNVVSVSFSPSSHFLLVGFAANRLLAFRRTSYPMAQIFHLPLDDQVYNKTESVYIDPVRCVYQQSDVTCTYRGINCIRWAPISGQGLIYGTNTGELGMLY